MIKFLIYSRDLKYNLIQIMKLKKAEKVKYFLTIYLIWLIIKKTYTGMLLNGLLTVFKNLGHAKI